MYMDDNRQSAKNEKELETLIQPMKEYSQDSGIEFGMLILWSEKRQITEGIELSNQEKAECSEKWKSTSTSEYWK